MSLPETSRQGGLLDLPLAALYAIVHKVGPRSRELCRALRRVFGPLPRLTPRGCHSLDELLSTLLASSDHHHHLTSLDLSHLLDLMTDDALLALCAALPTLRVLHLPTKARPYLPSLGQLTVAAVASATAQLPCLASLHVPLLRDMYYPPADDSPLLGWSHLRDLTLPAPLMVPGAGAALPRFTALSSLFLQGPRHMRAPCLAPWVAQLPALVALQLRDACCLDDVPHLRGLTRLTALALDGAVLEAPGSTRALLQGVGALTGLRSLHVRLSCDSEFDDAHLGWPTRLALLTSLRVDLNAVDQFEVESTGFDEVASSVPHLPALRSLQIVQLDNTGVTLPAAACARIASAGSRLGLLALGGLTLPPTMFTEVLPRLTALSCLRLNSIYHVHTTFSWLTALSNLRELGYIGNMMDYSAPTVLPWHLLAGLTNVDTLTLANCEFVDGPYLVQLCASMVQLRSLELTRSSSMGAAVSALQRLTNLEELGFLQGWAADAAGLLEDVSAPPSLRRCYLRACLGGGWQPKEQVAARALLGRHVDVVFGRWASKGWQ